MIAWLKLLRLPNVFTAAADVLMGYLITWQRLEPVGHVAWLLAASCLLYLSGMVLNDVFDADIDARERPERPIPSGRVSLPAAQNLGTLLLLGGMAAAWIAAWTANDWRPVAFATLLAICVLLYDAVLKRTAAAPLLMGLCRFFNVMLGMSLAIPYWSRGELLIAGGIGVYVVGVTIFARTEARQTSRGRLIVGLAVLVGGMALLAGVPALTLNRPPLVVGRSGWYLLWIVLALITARRCVLAILQPNPARVQAAVRHCVLSIIVLDAALCAGYVGPFWGLAVFTLIFPTLLLAAWLRAT